MSDYKPFVSLILPAFNEEKIISMAIHSSLGQDYDGKYEIIVIDDGSTDNTADVVNSFIDERIRMIQHTMNHGKPAALNSGFSVAKGEISIFADTDSYFSKNFISSMIKHFEDPKVGMVSGMVIIDNDINLLTAMQHIEYIFSQYVVRHTQHLVKNVLICPGAGTAVRTEITQNIPSDDRTITEDADFSFRVAKEGWYIEQEIKALTYTDAPTTIGDFINQRKRWLYGVLQTIKLHTWRKDLWTLWAWLGYITNPLTILFLVSIPVFAYFMEWRYITFFVVYACLAYCIFFVTRAIPLIQFGNGKRWYVFLLPVYVLYQILLQILLFYLVIMNVTGLGIKVRYGGKMIHAK